MSDVKLNNDQQLYVIKNSSGFSTYGYEYLKGKLERLEKEYKLDVTSHPLGSIELYNRYNEVVNIAHEQFKKTGLQSKSELNTQLLPYLRNRVEVEYQDGTKERFIVGKSTGWIPCLLSLKNASSSGGSSISHDIKFKSIRIIKK